MNWNNLTLALDFYKSKGFTQIEVPWIVDSQTNADTMPPGAHDFKVDGGGLIGSGEQGFLQMMKDGTLPPGRYCTLTPCFRKEPVVDDLHKLYFMKVELIDTGSVCLFDIIYKASDFFRRIGIDTAITNTGEYMFDLEEQMTGYNVEMGSYGVRTVGEYRWVYGTGCAEPRASFIQSKI